MIRTLSVSFLVSALLLGCTEDKTSTTDLDWKIYRQAISVADLVTAAGAMNSVLAKDSTQLNAYDSLALVYLNLGMDRSAVLIARKGLKKSESEALLEVTAAGLKNLGDIDGSLQKYLRLLELKPNEIDFMYEVAYGYIQIQGYEQALQYINLIVAHPESGTELMTEFVNKTGQKIPFKAVALNMRGFIQMQSGDNDGAIRSYQQAVEIVPDYQLALNNLNVLSAKLANGN